MTKQLLQAIFSGDVKTFDELAQPADLNAVTDTERWNLLHRALVSVSHAPAPAMIKRLIERGVDVNARDYYGNTPLHYAARLKRLEPIDMLLAAGATIDPVNTDGLTPLRLMLMSKPTNLHAIELLLSRGADMNHKVEGGRTVREYANVISHGTDRSIIDLFDKYSDRTPAK